MSKTEKILVALGLVIVAVVGVVFPKSQVSLGGVIATSTAGVTANNAKVATVIMQPLTAAATTSSILNTDAVDRIVESTILSCSGVGTSQTYLTGTGLASWYLTIATSSSVVPNNGNTNALASSQNAIATSSAELFTASTTPGQVGLGAYVRRWGPGTYMNFLFNATNTASCIVGVHYVLD